MTIADLTEDQIQERINEIDQEALEIKRLKSSNRISSTDIEDVSDNYQWNLEWNYALSELSDERNMLVQARNQFHIGE